MYRASYPVLGFPLTLWRVPCACPWLFSCFPSVTAVSEPRYYSALLYRALYPLCGFPATLQRVPSTHPWPFFSRDSRFGTTASNCPSVSRIIPRAWDSSVPLAFSFHMSVAIYFGPLAAVSERRYDSTMNSVPRIIPSTRFSSSLRFCMFLLRVRDPFFKVVFCP